MINTKSLISELKEVPREWVFENYLKLTEKLTGQDVRIKSPFNTVDKVPSMFIYWSNQSHTYRFKDFSTGKTGDGVSLVHILFNLSTRGEAAYKIMTDYNQFILINKEDYSLREFKLQQRYKVVSHVKRSWTNLDQKFWTSFYISSKILEHYNVFPLESYKMAKEVEEEVHELSVTGNNYIYGYFRNDGTLYKIYQPMVKDLKFIKIKDYIQGTDQLFYQSKYFVINSSLKDIMFFNKLGYNAETVAPDSENTLIPEHIINSYRLKYQGICTLFDNDQAGIESAKKYETKYGIKSVILPLSKDLSDSGKEHGILKVKEILTPLLKEALTCTK